MANTSSGGTGLKSTIKTIVFIASLAFFSFLVWKSWEPITHLPIRFSIVSVAFGIACLSVYCAGIVIIGLVWARSFSWIGSPISVGTGLIHYCIAGIGKYVPGNVAQQVGRVALVRGEGVPVSVGSLSILVEFILAGTAALLLSLPMIASQMQRVNDLFFTRRLLTMVVVGSGVLGLALVAALARKSLVLSRVPGLLARKAAPAIASLAAMTVAFALLAAVNGLVAAGLLGFTGSVFWSFFLAFPVAWLAGFFTPGAPAGLGTREFVMAGLLGADFGFEAVSMVAIAVRVVTTLGDLLLYLGAAFARRRGVPARIETQTL